MPMTFRPILSWGTIDEIYQLAEHSTHAIQRIILQWNEASELHTLTNKSIHHLQDMCEYEDVERFLRAVRRYRFEHFNASIPWSFQAEETLQIITPFLQTAEISYPYAVEILQQMRSLFERFVGDHRNPLLEQVKSQIHLSSGHHDNRLLNGILFFEDRLMKLSKPYIGKINASLIHHQELRDVVRFDTLLVIGDTRRYPEFLFRSPRAHHIHIIAFKEQTSALSFPPTFGDALYQRQSVFNSDVDRSNEEDFGLDPDDHYYTSDSIQHFVSISSRYEDRDHSEWHSGPVDAIFIEIAGNKGGVFIEADEDTKNYVIDLEEGEDEDSGADASGLSVKHLPYSGLYKGMFLLLRTSGRQDYIALIADKILGEMAPFYREHYERWKRALHDLINRHSSSVIETQLRFYGAKIPTSANLSRWATARSIKPRNQEDFRAILRCLGRSKILMNYGTLAK